MKLSDKIQRELIGFVTGNSNEISVPNFFMGSFEADLMVIKNSGYVYEYEIKISKSDYQNDFKKCSGFIDDPNSFKHVRIESGQHECNRFFFVVPKDLITIDECPKYAGLIYYNNQWLTLIKNAPILHKRKYDSYRALSCKLAARAEFARSKQRRIQYDLDIAHLAIEELKKKLGNNI